MKGLQLKRRNSVDLTHSFCWITAAGAVIGLVAAVQQLLIHGLQPFLRAVFVIFVVGLGSALVYPHIQVRTVGGRTQVDLALSTTRVESTPVRPAPLNRTPLSPTTVSPAATPDESSVAAPVPFNLTPIDPTTVDSTFTLTKPAPAPPAPVDTAPVGLAPLGPTTAGPAATPAESRSAAPTQVELTPVGPTPVGLNPAPLNSAPIKPAPSNRTPSKPVTVQSGRATSEGFKPTLPALLPPQQTHFSPSEVAYCPICSCAYWSKGPTVGVKCPHCDGKVNLVSSRDYMVHRCGKCGRLYRTTHFPPAIGPYFFRYYCSFCKEYHWFLD
jgi:hypothetical protein